MPAQLTYPGVYVEEIPSGVRAITGVATSITAFVGRARRGPIDEARTINSFADFERIFGGRWVKSSLGSAIRDFYLNGGSQAVVVRLFGPSGPGASEMAELDAKTGESLRLRAADPGEWGNYLRSRVDHDVSPDAAEALGVDVGDLFNLVIRDMGRGDEEVFRNVTLLESPRRLDRVLEQGSALVRVESGVPDTGRPDQHAAAAPNADIWADDTLSTGVDSTDQVTDGEPLTEDEFTGGGKEAAKEGLYALEEADLFNILCIPPYKADGNADTGVVDSAASYCERRRAVLLVDPPSEWANTEHAKVGVGGVGTRSKNAALYFPRLRQPNPLRGNQMEAFAPCGAVAGILARTDAQRGVWKAPAGLDAALVGVPELTVPLTDAENGQLNPLGVNCLRVMPGAGPVVWGARTLQGDDRLASEWKYLPVRRLALFIEESLYRGTHWVVFEPNDEPLWAQIRLNAGAFMHRLFRQGAFQGTSPRDAYFVKCDKETTTQDDINLGVVNILVGFAPLKPAEFVVIRIQQMAGQTAT